MFIDIFVSLIVAAVVIAAVIGFVVVCWKKPEVLVMVAFVSIMICGFIFLPGALADEYDLTAEVISIIYIDDVVEFDDGVDCFTFQGGANEHHLGDVLCVVMDNMRTPLRTDDVIVETWHTGETEFVETYYIVSVDNVVWAAFVYEEDVEEFIRELTEENITAQLIIVG